jgi:hypothetical protein
VQAVDQRPAAVVEIASASDAQSAVRTATGLGHAVSAQFSGHAATRALDDTVVERTARLGQVEVDTAARMARIGAGVSWAQLLVDRFVAAAGAPGQQSILMAQVRHLGGAFALPSHRPTASGPIDDPFLLFVVALAFGPPMTDRFGELSSALGPELTGRTAFTMLSADDPVQRAFTAPELEALRATKQRVDPRRLAAGHAPVYAGGGTARTSRACDPPQRPTAPESRTPGTVRRHAGRGRTGARSGHPAARRSGWAYGGPPHRWPPPPAPRSPGRPW